jgi:GNAT superfamily N-acetyltransferase
MEDIPERFSDTDPVWRIESDSGEVAGYGWLRDQRADAVEPGWTVMAAVYDEFKGQRMARFALERLELEARTRGIVELQGTVLNARAGTGVRVRRLLLHLGYLPDRRSHEHYGDLSDEAFVLKLGLPLRFTKRLA